MLASLRDARPAGPGYGTWNAGGEAEFATWREFLLAIADDEPHHRTAGWTRKLRSSPGGDAGLARYMAMLESVAIDDVQRCVVHSDLINRNVHVHGGTISGVFDWGCSLYGDQLFDLAWLEFWSPWHPNLDLTSLRVGPVDAAGSNIERRLLACLLYIGLGHIVYNAHLEDWPEVANVERRLAAVCEQFG